MSFFDKIFDCNVLNQTGITGLNKELSALFVYNTFIKNKENILLVLNSTYEANLFYNKLLNYTSNVLFFPMDDFITSEALAVSPEFKTERLITLNKLSSNDKKYIVVSNLMGVLRYLPSVRTWKENIIKLKKELERQGAVIQETVATLAEQSGGERQQNGSYKIPEDKIASLNAQLDDFGKEEIEIEYTPIRIKESDNVPPTLMDALFDFIELE